MLKFRSLLPIVVFLLIGGVAFAGCGEQTISQDEMTTSIKQQYREQTGIELTGIDCDEVKPEKGAPVSCSATNASDVNLKLTGEVTGENKDSDKWRFNWEVSEQDAPGELFADPAAKTVESKVGVTVKSIKCPERIKVVKGAKVPCKATYDDGSTGEISLELTDEEGGFRVMIEK